MEEHKKLIPTILLDLLSSSSSDESDSDDDTFTDELLFLHTVKKLKVQFEEYEDDTSIDLRFLDQYTESEFRDLFHLKKLTALEIIEKYKISNFSKIKIPNYKNKLCPELQILAFLQFASTETKYKNISAIYNIQTTTFHQYLNCILDFFVEISSEYVKFPRTENELLETSNQYKKIFGLQNVIGCINDFRILTKKLVKTKTADNKLIENKSIDTYIITVQAVCNAKMNFIDIFIKAPCKKDEINVFNTSILSKNLPKICKSNYYVLGSNCYPLKEYLITPIICNENDEKLTKKQKLFNMKHKKARRLIDNTFERLKLRFKQLKTLNFYKIDNICKFILACCIIHNICIKNNDNWLMNDSDSELIDNNEEDNQNQEEDNNEKDNENLVKILEPGEIKRQKIVDSL